MAYQYYINDQIDFGNPLLQPCNVAITFFNSISTSCNQYCCISHHFKVCQFVAGCQRFYFSYSLFASVNSNINLRYTYMLILIDTQLILLCQTASLLLLSISYTTKYLLNVKCFKKCCFVLKVFFLLGLNSSINESYSYTHSSV